MKPIGVTLQRTYLTKICKKNYCAVPKIFGNISGYIKKQQKKPKQNQYEIFCCAQYLQPSCKEDYRGEGEGKLNEGIFDYK